MRSEGETYKKNMEELLDGPTSPQRTTPPRPDPQHTKPTRPGIITACPTISNARRSTSATYVRTKGTQVHRTMNGERVSEMFPFVGEEYTEEGASDIAPWAIRRGIEEYPHGRHLGQFVWKVIEHPDYASRHRHSVSLSSCTARELKLEIQVWIRSLRLERYLDSNVRAGGSNHKEAELKRFCIRKLNEREDERRYSQERTKARIATSRQATSAYSRPEAQFVGSDSKLGRIHNR